MQYRFFLLFAALLVCAAALGSHPPAEAAVAGNLFTVAYEGTAR
jgi:hypothetical protein